MLPGKFQSNRLEADFGIYRQSSGGNYWISVEQIVSSMQLQRIKLFSRLSMLTGLESEWEFCCAYNIKDNEEDLELVITSFSEAS